MSENDPDELASLLLAGVTSIALAYSVLRNIKQGKNLLFTHCCCYFAYSDLNVL